MKKFILGGAFAAALVLGAAYSYNKSNAGLSNLQMLNAEALAQAECSVTELGHTFVCDGSGGACVTVHSSGGTYSCSGNLISK